MSKFEQDAKALLQAVGGQQNILAVSHCATRMRFVLGDDSLADQKQIEQLPSVKGMFTNAGQFQVIIGNDVATFYQDFQAISGIEGVSKDAVKKAAKGSQNPLQRLIANLAEIFTPLLPAIIVGGLILGIRNILDAVQFGGQTIVEMSQFWAGVDSFLWLPGEAIFHFLPVGIAWSVTKKMGTTQILGIVLGITLVSPQLLNAYAVNSTSAAEIVKNWTWDFGFFTLEKIGYQAQVIPAMAAAFLLAYLEKFFRKYIAESVSMIFVPLLSLIPTIVVAHAVIGPIGWQIGKGISWVVNSGLTSSFNWLFGAVFGALYAPLVITGLHHMTLAIDTQLIADYGSTNLWPMIDLSNIAQGASVLAVYLLHRKNQKEAEISVPSTISAWLGVTEPAMFGINLKYVFPFVAAMIGSGIAGLLSTLMGVRANAIGVGGLPGILAIRGQDMLKFLLPMAVAIVLPMILTAYFEKVGLFSKTPLKTIDVLDDPATLKGQEHLEAQREASLAPLTILSPLQGQVKNLSEAPDPVFSQGILGSGVMIEPSLGEVHAPFDGVVTATFPSKHAIGLVSDTGVEVLIHVGLDTVKLDGQGFDLLVAQGDQVKAQDLLLTFDIASIQAKGYSIITPVVVTNQTDYQVDVLAQLPSSVAIGDNLLKVQKTQSEV